MLSWNPRRSSIGRGALAGKQDAKAIDKLNNRINQQLDHVASVLEEFPSGTPIRLITPASKSIFYGVVVGIDAKKAFGQSSGSQPLEDADSGGGFSPAVDSAPIQVQSRDEVGRWKPRFKPKIGSEMMSYSLFDKQQEAGRVNRQIFTGNLIKAFEKYPNGKLVNYTDYQGQVRQGLMMPKGFDIQERIGPKEPVAFSTPQQVMTFVTELTNRRGIVKTLDELLILKTQFNGEGFVLQTPKAKESGGKYFSG